MQPKRSGVVFDTPVSEPARNRYPPEEITVPTLVVHAVRLSDTILTGTLALKAEFGDA